jgi:hypothetical protein
MQQYLRRHLPWCPNANILNMFFEYRTQQITHNGFAVIGVAETNADGLVNEKYIRLGIPRVRIKNG